QVVGIALHKALRADYRPDGGPGAAAERDACVGVDGLRGPQSMDEPLQAQRGREVVGGPERGPDATIAVVADEVASRGPTRLEVVNRARGPEVRPAAGKVVAVGIERLIVVAGRGEVGAGLVTRAVHPAPLEQERPELVAGDGVEVEGADVGRLLVEEAGRPGRGVEPVGGGVAEL